MDNSTKEAALRTFIVLSVIVAVFFIAKCIIDYSSKNRDSERIQRLQQQVVNKSYNIIVEKDTTSSIEEYKTLHDSLQTLQQEFYQKYH